MQPYSGNLNGRLGTLTTIAGEDGQREMCGSVSDALRVIGIEQGARLRWRDKRWAPRRRWRHLQTSSSQNVSASFLQIGAARALQVMSRGLRSTSGACGCTTQKECRRVSPLGSAAESLMLDAAQSGSRRFLALGQILTRWAASGIYTQHHIEVPNALNSEDVRMPA